MAIFSENTEDPNTFFYLIDNLIDGNNTKNNDTLNIINNYTLPYTIYSVH